MYKVPIQVLPDSSLPACSLLVEPMATSAESSSAIPSRSMTSSVGVSSSSDVTSSSESPTQSLAVPYISSAPTSSISVAPSVTGPSSSSVYRAASSSPPPAVPIPTPSGPQGVRAHILTYIHVCKRIRVCTRVSVLCLWCLYVFAFTVLVCTFKSMYVFIYVTACNFTERIAQ